MKHLASLCLLLSTLVFAAANAEAASHYIRAGATGANNGSSWNDAWTNFPGSTAYVRGDEYYVASGSYTGGNSFSTSASGSTVIKICKATDSTIGSCSTAHGSDTGWQTSYGDGQAIISGTTGVSFTKANWVFDGVVGSGSDFSSYGFYFTPPRSGTTIRPVQFGGFSDSANNIQIKHTAVTCPGSSGDIQQFGYSGYGNSVTLTSVYVDNCQVSMWTQGDDNIIENSYFGKHWSSSSNHGVQVEQIVRPIFRNNIVTMCSPQCIEPGGGSTTNITNGQYYNNVFANIDSGNGVLKGVSSGSIINTVMYGNTVVNSAGPILYQNNEGLGNGSGNTVVNNLFYNCSSIINQSTGGPISHSFNALFNSGSISETGVQISSGNPFVNSAAGNYNLKAATNAGLALSAPFNTDVTGAIRGSDGVWDRGAYEFESGSGGLPVPTNLQIQ